MKPELQFSILCDDVRQEKSGKFMFLGVFNLITVQKLPIVYPVFYIANQWCAGAGVFRERSRIVDEENRVVVESPEIAFKLRDFAASHFVISRFQGVRLEKAGKYSVEILLDRELFRRFPFNVVPVKKERVS